MSVQFFAYLGDRERHTTVAMLAARHRRSTADLFALGERIACAQEVYLEELAKHTRELRPDGVTVLGVTTADEAKGAARAALCAPPVTAAAG
jgi:hypothetical protein